MKPVVKTTITASFNETNSNKKKRRLIQIVICQKLYKGEVYKYGIAQAQSRNLHWLAFAIWLATVLGFAEVWLALVA